MANTRKTQQNSSKSGTEETQRGQGGTVGGSASTYGIGAGGDTTGRQDTSSNQGKTPAELAQPKASEQPRFSGDRNDGESKFAGSRKD